MAGVEDKPFVGSRLARERGRKPQGAVCGAEGFHVVIQRGQVICDASRATSLKQRVADTSGRENRSRDIEREKSSSQEERNAGRGDGDRYKNGEKRKKGREETRVGEGGTGSGIKMRVVTDGGRIFHLIPRWWKNCICPRQPLGFE